MAVFGILTVCTGNICRSPLAELVLRDRLSEVPGVELASAGTAAERDILMPAPAAELARELGVVPDGHRSQFVAYELIALSDLILAMSREHRRYIVTEMPRVLNRTFTIREFARLGSGLTADEITGLAKGDSVFERLSSLVASMAVRRGIVAAAESEQDDDVVDPYGRSAETYRLTADQLIPAVDEVVRLFRIAALPSAIPA